MAELRACVYLLVILVLFQRTFASPLFGSSLFCSLFCDYGDDDDSGGSFVDDILSLFGDSSEETQETSKPTASVDTPAGANAKPQEISLLIPPASGMNLTLQSLGSSLWVSLFPWAGGSSATTAAPTTTAPTAPAGNGTAANATAA